MKKRLYGVVATVMSLSMAGQAFALGTASYSSELISSKSLGMGGVGVAGATDDVSASYTNPAALTALKGTQVTIGGTYVNASPTFTSAGSNATSPASAAGDVSGARATSVFVPNFGISSQFFGGKLAAGLAVVDPYGLETHFDGNSPVRYAATDARLRIIDITPSVAYKVCSGFSIGVGADYYDTIDGALDHAVNVSALNAKLGSPGLAADGSSALAATGDGWGYHVGTTFEPNEHHKIGLVYHSNVKMSLSGNVQLSGLSGASALVFGGPTFTAAATAPVYIPQNVQLGYAYKPNDKWVIEADAAWYDWYDARQLGVVYSGLNATQTSILGTPQSFDPRKTLNFGLGAQYKKDDAWQFRGGAYYEGASLPESAFDPAFADLPRYGLTAGLTYAFTSALSVDAAYNAVMFHSRSINQNQIAQGQAGFYGSFSSFANILSANLNYKFDTHF